MTKELLEKLRTSIYNHFVKEQKKLYKEKKYVNQDYFNSFYIFDKYGFDGHAEFLRNQLSQVDYQELKDYCTSSENYKYKNMKAFELHKWTEDEISTAYQYAMRKGATIDYNSFRDDCLNNRFLDGSWGFWRKYYTYKKRWNFKPLIYDHKLVNKFDYWPEVWSMQDLKMYKIIKHHQYYNTMLLLGVLLWCTALFWVPFAATYLSYFKTCIIDMLNHTYNHIYMSPGFTGFGIMVWACFTAPVTQPLLFICSVTVHPFLLKLILFGKHGYDEQIMELLKKDKNIESHARTGILAGTVISKLFNK